MVHMGRSRVGLVVNIKEKIIADGPSPIDIMRMRSIRPEFRVFYRRYRDISGEGLPWEIGRNQFDSNPSEISRGFRLGRGEERLTVLHNQCWQRKTLLASRRPSDPLISPRYAENVDQASIIFVNGPSPKDTFV